MTGIFTLSIDTEGIWGLLHWGWRQHEKSLLQERDIILRLLDLLARYDFSATWAVVGHLFLDRCGVQDGKKHPDMPRPFVPGMKDWYADDPAGDQTTAPLFYGKDIVDMLLRASPVQEIGCHGFSHALFDGIPADVADAEIGQCTALAKARGITLRSMVFPQNSIGHLPILKKHGFLCYRGPDPLFYRSWPRLLQRLFHPLDVALALPPPVTEPVKTPEGLWNIPGSMLYLSCDGPRTLIPVASRVQKAKTGIDRAVAQNKIFHLWFHPFNLVSSREAMLHGLEEIFSYAVEKRKEGKLEILPMGAVAERWEG